MKKILILIAVLISTAIAQDIIVSKDSLWCLNNFTSGQHQDSLKIINNGSLPVLLDSARLIIYNWYPKNSFFRASNAQVMITESKHGVNSFDYFSVDSINAPEYNLDFTMSSKPYFSIGHSGDSTILKNFEIGGNFFGDVPVYPLYFTGLLKLYFSNWQIVSVRLYSDDLRPTIVKRVLPVKSNVAVVGNRRQYLINGQKITANVTEMKKQHLRYRTCEITTSK